MNNALTQLEAIELAKVSIAYQRYIIRFLWVMLAVHVFEVTVDLYPYIERLF